MKGGDNVNKISEDKALKMAYELTVKAIEAGSFSNTTDGIYIGEQISRLFETVVDKLTQNNLKND
jgi:hypothetical protein